MLQTYVNQILSTLVPKQLQNCRYFNFENERVEYLIHKCSIWVYLVDHVYSFGQPSSSKPTVLFICPTVSQGKNFEVGHTYISINCSIPIMLTGTIDFEHFIPFSLTFPSAGAHKASPKQNLLVSFSHTLLEGLG